MESVYQVQITEQAKQQIREIARYIALELKDPDAALREPIEADDRLVDMFHAQRHQKFVILDTADAALKAAVEKADYKVLGIK